MNSQEKFKQKYITDFFKPKKIYGYNPQKNSWHCIECGENMGKNNPRQLCGKYYCQSYYFFKE